MKLLDLFCCEGGAGTGYRRAGFEVVGVDKEPQPRYPFTFAQGDALEYIKAHGHEFDAIHASPPCQRYSILTPTGFKENHPDLIAAVRTALKKSGKPFIIENVPGARFELEHPFRLCGTMFGLKVQRHRYFEAPWWTQHLLLSCNHSEYPIVVSGTTRRLTNGKRRENLASECRAAMETPWMSRHGLDEAIPPAYTEFIGRELMKHLRGIQ